MEPFLTLWSAQLQMEFVAVVSHMLLTFEIRVLELVGYEYMRIIMKYNF